MFIALVIHKAAPEHTEEFIAFMHMVVEATRDAPGLLDFTPCRDVGGGFLAGVSRWESAEAFEAALPTILSLAPERRPEWSTAPDELILLVEV